jgi:hypothetical protein
VDWIISAISVTSLILVGNKQKAGWLLALANQVLWAVFALTVGKPGLLVGVAAYTIVNLRNYRRWCREEEAK